VDRPRSFAGASLFLLAGLFVAALTLFFRRLGLIESGSGIDRGAKEIVDLVYLGAWLLAGWFALRLVQAARELIVLRAEQGRTAARSADLIEHGLIPALLRIAEAVERAEPSSGQAADGMAAALARARQAVKAGDWLEAESLVLDFAQDFPDAPQGAALLDQIAEGRQAAIEDLRARIDAAKQVNDPGRVLELHDELAGYLDSETHRDLDPSLVSWLMGLVRMRMSELPLRTDVVELATQIAERFGGTPEGASLRKALPVLRRSVGLCPRCAQPYVGIDDACPECLARVVTPRLLVPVGETTTNGPSADRIEEPPSGSQESPFLDHDEHRD
jgi:hypothetical protein